MLYEKISNDIKTAMKSKEELRLSVLRMIKSKIMTVNARGDMPDEEVLKIIKSYSKSLKDALEQTRAGGRMEEAATLEAELAIVAEFLPQALTTEQLTEIIKDIVEKGAYMASSDFGKVMKVLMQNHKNIDGVAAKNIINSFLK